MLLISIFWWSVYFFVCNKQLKRILVENKGKDLQIVKKIFWKFEGFYLVSAIVYLGTLLFINLTAILYYIFLILGIILLSSLFAKFRDDDLEKLPIL